MGEIPEAGFPDNVSHLNLLQSGITPIHSLIFKRF